MTANVLGSNPAVVTDIYVSVFIPIYLINCISLAVKSIKETENLHETLNFFF